MLSLSLGRDGWVEAAAPAPALMRIAALPTFVAVQLFFVGNTRSCTIRDAGPTAMQHAATLRARQRGCTQVQAPEGVEETRGSISH